jgi:hypothetical protein
VRSQKKKILAPSGTTLWSTLYKEWYRRAAIILDGVKIVQIQYINFRGLNLVHPSFGKNLMGFYQEIISTFILYWVSLLYTVLLYSTLYYSTPSLGLLWATLGNLGEPWGTLGNLGEPWGTLGNLWSTLGNLGLPWPTLGFFGLPSATLGYQELLWATLSYIGRPLAYLWRPWAP